MAIGINSNKKKSFFSIPFILIFLLVINITILTIYAQELTEEEKEFLRKLRERGINIKDGNSETIGGRKFSQENPSGNGFVQEIREEGKESYFKTKNIEISTNQNIKIKTSPDTETFVGFKEGVDFSNIEKFIKISGSGNIKNIDISGNKFKTKFSTANPQEFVIDNEGKLSVGTKFTTINDKYVLNGYSITLPENTEIEFLEDKVTIKIPKDSKVDPKVENPSLVRGRIEIQSQGHDSLQTNQGRFQSFSSPNVGQITTKPSSIFYEYENGNLLSYTEDPIGVFFNNKGEVDFSFVNSIAGTSNSRLYISFDQNLVDTTKPTLLVTNDFIGSINDQGLGPVINLGKGNRFNVGINRLGGNDLASGKKTVSFQGNKGYAILSRSEQGKLARLLIKGNSIYSPDKVTFFGDINSNKYYYRPTTTIEQVAHGEGTAALKVGFVGQNNQELGFDLFSNNENQFMQAPEGQLQGNEDIQFFGKDGAYFSPNVAFNLLDPEKRKFLSTLTQNELRNLQSDIINSAGVAGLEAQLAKIEEGRRSPLRASVATGGCSGTIVGISGDKAYVLTAAHCGRGSRNIYLNKLDSDGQESRYPLGRRESLNIRGRVVARNSGTDLALLEITPSAEQMQQIQLRGFARVAPKGFEVNTRDSVTMIGCPGGHGSFRVSSCQVTGVNNRIRKRQLTTNINPRGGQSGGGLFKGRYLIGVVQTRGRGYVEGGYGNLASIYSLLDRNGYTWIYQFILIFYIDKTVF